MGGKEDSLRESELVQLSGFRRLLLYCTAKWGALAQISLSYCSIDCDLRRGLHVAYTPKLAERRLISEGHPHIIDSVEFEITIRHNAELAVLASHLVQGGVGAHNRGSSPI